MKKLEAYDYFFIACEGANEESVFYYIADSGRLKIDKAKCFTDHMRSHTRETQRSLIKDVFEYNFDGRVAILNIRDREKEAWNITAAARKEMTNRAIDIIPVVTAPEIEYLLILKDEQCLKEWQKIKIKDRRINPSGFCKEYYDCDVKKGKHFIGLFKDFNEFVGACRKYAAEGRNINSLTLYDLIED